MTTSHLPRRVILGAVLAASLIGVGVVAAVAEGAPTCPPTYTDPAGDSGVGDPATNPVTGDDDLDIVAVTHSVDGGSFTTSVKVAELYPEGPLFAMGDRFITAFTVAKKAVEITAERDFSGVGSSRASAKVGGTAVTFPVKLVEDLKASTISAVMSAADLEKAIGAPLAGQEFSAMTSAARAVYPTNASPGTAQPAWDTATAAATAKYAFGTGCGGETSAGPAPASAAPAPAPSPSSPPTAAPPAGGAPATAGLPAADCVLTKDPKGDAALSPLVGGPGLPNDPDLDLTSLTLGTDSKNLVGYFKVDKLANGPAVTEGHRFYLSFTFNKHSFTMAGSAYKNGEAPIRDGLSQTGQVAATTQLAVDGVSSATDPARFTGAGTGFVPSGLKFTFDLKNSYVIAALPLADLEKYGKAPAAGATLTGIYASANADNFAVATGVDSAPDGASASAPGKLTYAVGDNRCFAPPAPPLTSLGAVKAQYGDVAPVAAKLVDAAGTPVAGKTVTFTLGSSQATGTTGADGVAKAALLVKETAGKRSMVITSGDAKVVVDFTVTVEKTALRAVGGKSVVTATLTDDDTSPVPGQVITFASGSKKISVKTDAKGVAKATGLPPGNVKVSYPGAAGMYAGSSTTTKSS